MNQNGYEPMNRNGISSGTFGAANQTGYTDAPSGFPAQYSNQNTGGPSGSPYSYSAQGYFSSGYGQTGGYPAGNGNPQPFGAFSQNLNTGAVNPGYSNNIQGGYAAPGGYPDANGYYSPPMAGSVGNGYNPAAAAYGTGNPQTIPTTGSFIPQTPYSPGYTSPGYQQPAASYYQPGAIAYNQMGRNTQSGQTPDPQIRQMPLNGGGYVPQKIPVRRGPFELKDFVLVAVGGVLLILCILGLILGMQSNIPAQTVGTVIRVLFIILAAASAGALWIRPVTAQNKRLCFTIVAAVLITVTLISFVIPTQAPTINTNTGKVSSSAAATNQEGQTQQAATAVNPGTNADNIVQPAEQSVTTAPPAATNEAADRLGAFLTYWGGNRLEEMLMLCAPSWLSKLENPKNELFSLLQNRTPKEFMLENITGTDADSSRQITMKIKIDRNNGKEPVVYRMTVLMLKESGEWYVDPKSLQSNEVDVTPDPNVTPTQAPTPTPYVDANTVLYYNPDGGELYHLDQNCKIINARYLPLKGHFTYGQINESQYSELKPCNVCGAPLK